MAEGMARLLFDLNLRNRVIAGARQKVRDDFDNRKLINNLAALFEQAGLKDA
jgi:hypothetical protein